VKNKAVILLILGSILMPSLIGVQAAAGGLLKGLPDSCYKNGDCTFCNVMQVGVNIFIFLRDKIAFPIAVLFILYGGVLMIFAGGSKSQIENGKKILFAALIGFAIVLAVSLILNSVLMVLSKEKGGWQAFVNGSIGCGIEQNLNTP
jgi:hypothetical protein